MSKKRKRFFLNALIVLIILLALTYTCYRIFFKSHTVNVGDPAPNFTVENLQGQTLNLHSLKGKGVMINFWQSDCDPCKEEMPFINEAYHQLKSSDNIVILEVNLDESKSVVSGFKEKYDLDFPIWLDHHKIGQDLYNVQGIPTTFFVDASGQVVEKVQGYMESEKAIMEKLEQIRP
ncbi:peroxiredoxin [Pullulanibacillus pueri]|uniref:Thioredoxin domain-containing protein n=1 Tax=Pullulanibacillus pueri TaxID=1437324 RepID=A0A8J2ZVD8_9BACL|nr:thiol-disulfide oxidoreductase ResA [Pullulanibacillus pueri]MBM7681506.1 peroxiredoxin [Pullulanibacillus pueri]GGH79152.1 hypothetical protein GCM10007096_13660 [Pullulanibacillus pueri]